LAITFESGSKLSRIADSVLLECSSLLSIRIPSSVEKLCQTCFSGCQRVATVSFESDSKLSRVSSDAFRNCSSLSSLWVPWSLETMLRAYGARLKIIETAEK
jgi:hypothetical protein